MKNYHLPIIIEYDENGYYAECPLLQGCYSQGDTYEEALANIRDAVKLHLEDRIADKETTDFEGASISLAMVDVAA